LRVTSEPLVAIRALSTIGLEAKSVLAEMVEEARKADTRQSGRRIETIKAQRIAATRPR
jgi:hypothetical protein